MTAVKTKEKAVAVVGSGAKAAEAEKAANAVAKEAEGLGVTQEAMSQVPTETKQCTGACEQQTGARNTPELAEFFAASILQNPQIERYLTRPPFDSGKCGDFESPGAKLAHESFLLAKDYEEQMSKEIEQFK